jgi:hypothetical protein
MFLSTVEIKKMFFAVLAKSCNAFFFSRQTRDAKKQKHLETKGEQRKQK